MEGYDFDEASIAVETLSDDTAVIAYKVTERIRVGGEPITMVAHDSSAWRRENGNWVCVLHTESPAGDAFGRDRK
jgi:hypothetical protein